MSKKDYSESEVKLAIRLSRILSTKRATDRKPWLRVGYCLHNIAPDSADMKKEWHMFSALCPEKYKPDECDRLWDEAEATEDGYHIGSLHMWAKKDNPEAYKNICKSHYKEMKRTFY